MYITDVEKQERDKYSELWDFEDYHQHSPGLVNVERFLKIIKPDIGESLIDLGCGAGVAGLKFKEHGLNVRWLDITKKAKKPEIDERFFYEAPLWGDWKHYLNGKFDYGYCADVMEHIPTEYTMLCAKNIIKNCRTSWLMISLVEDNFGKIIGQPLHITVKPFEWWLVRLSTLGKVLDARDLCECGLFIINSDRV